MTRFVFYYHLSRLEKSDGYDELLQKIKDIHKDSKERYGYRRICLALNGEGITVNHKTVHKLMHQIGLKAKCKKRHYHSYKGEVGKVAPNVLQRNFEAKEPNRKWTTDVALVNIKETKLYLSLILDMFNGEIISYHIISYTISNSPNLKMVTSMLRKAFRKHKDLKGMVIHSDQVWHYQYASYQQMLKDKGIIQSMSRRSNCLNNAMMENFFGLMKNELLYINHFESAENFGGELKKYIQWYNEKKN